MEKRKPSSHILQTNISLSLNLSSAPASRTQGPKALLYFLLPVLGAGEDPDSIAIKILQGGSAGNWRSVQLTRVKRVKLHSCDGPSSSHLQGRGWTKEKSTEWWGRRKVCSVKSAFTAMSLTATVKHTTALQGGKDNHVFPHDGCLDSCPPGGQNCNSFSPQTTCSLVGWHHTIYKKRKMTLEFLEDRPPPNAYLC